METLKKLRQYDTLTVHNPLDEPFTVTWNKEPYTIGPHETLPFVQHIARHIAKHLAERILNQKGRAFVDQLKDGKPRGHVVQKSVVGELAHTLLDSEGDLNADELINDFRKKGGIKQLPEEEVKADAALTATKDALERERETNRKLEERMARMESMLMEKGASATSAPAPEKVEEEKVKKEEPKKEKEPKKAAPKKKEEPKKEEAPKEEVNDEEPSDDPLDEM